MIEIKFWVATRRGCCNPSGEGREYILYLGPHGQLQTNHRGQGQATKDLAMRQKIDQCTLGDL